jgi:hypothetical protein
MDKMILSLYHSILEQAANFSARTKPNVDHLPLWSVPSSTVRDVIPRPDRRTPDTPLMYTTILPTPRNTDCRRRVLAIPNLADLKLLTGEATIVDVTSKLLDELSEEPVASAVPAGFVKCLNRTEQGLQLISPDLPFDLKPHPSAAKAVAQQMLSRLTNDMKDYATDTNDNRVPKVVGLASDVEVRATVKDSARTESLLKELNALVLRLTALREADEKFLSIALPVILRTANDVEGTTTAASATPQRVSLVLELRRFAKKEATLSLDYLVSSLCSSSAEDEWARGRGEVKGFTVPAINIRGMTYDVARAIFRAAHKIKCGAFLFELDRRLPQTSDCLGGPLVESRCS